MADETTDATAAQPAPDDTAGQINVAGSSPEIVADDTTDDLKILMGEFEGPLDLLLHLIRQEQVSIYDIPVARIADEYLRYLKTMQDMDIAVAGDFLVMAATLIDRTSFLQKKVGAQNAQTFLHSLFERLRVVLLRSTWR